MAAPVSGVKSPYIHILPVVQAQETRIRGCGVDRAEGETWPVILLPGPCVEIDVLGHEIPLLAHNRLRRLLGETFGSINVGEVMLRRAEYAARHAPVLAQAHLHFRTDRPLHARRRARAAAGFLFEDLYPEDKEVDKRRKADDGDEHIHKMWQ